MLDVLTTVAIVVGIAWLGRMLLDARELTWGRLLLAALLGIALGDAAALFLLVSSFSEIPSVDLEQLQLVSLPFRIIATMGSIVALELFFRRARVGDTGTAPGGPRRRLRFGPRVAVRAVAVVRILFRHGFAPLLGWGSGRAASLDPQDLARRARLALEEAGGVYVKLGQLLASRPDLLSPQALAELSRLQSAVAPVPRAAIEAQMVSQLGGPLDEVFASVSWQPLGSASIAQAHAAELVDGMPVVIKVRRPGLELVIDRDLAILQWLARNVERRLGWARQLKLTRLAAEFAATLREELDFESEARNIAEIAAAVADEPLIRVPRVVTGLTRPGLLVMERLSGRPLSHFSAIEPVPDADRLADALCSSQVVAMLEGRRFHGDPHAGNVLVLEDGRIGLIDLGISGRLDAFERAAVFQMLLALRLEQPSLLVESMTTIGALDPAIHDPSEIERAMARFMTAYLAPGLPPSRALTDLLRLTLDLGLTLPVSTTGMFRALATLMGSLEELRPGYPVIEKIAELGGAEVKRRLLPSSAGEFIKQEWSEFAPLVRRLPHHVDRLATMLQHGRIATRTRVLADPDDRRFLEKLVNRFVLTFLSLGTGAVSTLLLGLDGGLRFPLLDVALYEVLGWIGLFIAMTLLFRVLLAVLRSEAPHGADS